MEVPNINFLDSMDKVALLELLTRVDDLTLASLCRTSKKYRDFCNSSDVLWMRRLLHFLGRYFAKIDPNRNPIDIIEEFRKNKNLSWKDYYIYIMNTLIRAILKGESVDKDEDDKKIVTIINKEPFSIYENRLYADSPDYVVSQDIYRKLDDIDKMWISSDMMLFHILVGNIKDENLIEEILNRKPPQGVTSIGVDVVTNTIDRDYLLSLDGIEHVLQFYKKNLEMIKTLKKQWKKMDKKGINITGVEKIRRNEMKEEMEDIKEVIKELKEAKKELKEAKN